MASIGEVLQFYLFAHLGIASLPDWDFDALFVPPDYGGLPVLTYPFKVAAQATGKPIYIWTINDPEQMNKLLEKHIQGILSDYPKTLDNQID